MKKLSGKPVTPLYLKSSMPKIKKSVETKVPILLPNQESNKKTLKDLSILSLRHA